MYNSRFHIFNSGVGYQTLALPRIIDYRANGEVGLADGSVNPDRITDYAHTLHLPLALWVRCIMSVACFGFAFAVPYCISREKRFLPMGKRYFEKVSPQFIYMEKEFIGDKFLYSCGFPFQSSQFKIILFHELLCGLVDVSYYFFVRHVFSLFVRTFHYLVYLSHCFWFFHGSTTSRGEQISIW